MTLPMSEKEMVEHLQHFVHEIGQVRVLPSAPLGFDATLEVADFFLGRPAPFYLNLADQYAQTGTQWTHAMGREMEFKFPLSQQLTRMVNGELVTPDESGNERPLNDAELWSLAGSILVQYREALANKS